MKTRGTALLLAAALTAALGGTWPAAANAAPTPAPAPPPTVSGDPQGYTIVITLPGAPGSDGKPPSEDGVSLDPCTYQYSPSGIVAENFEGTWPTQAEQASGKVRWYAILCPGQASGVTWVLITDPQPPGPPTPGQLAAITVKHFPLPTADVADSPVIGLVNLPEWLAVKVATWHIYTGHAALRGTNVTVTAQPSYALWTPGDGSAPVRCDGPGIAYISEQLTPAAEPTYCMHTYLQDSGGQPVDAKGDPSYPASVDVVWQLSWVGSQPGQPVETGTLPDEHIVTDYPQPVQQQETLVTAGGG